MRPTVHTASLLILPRRFLTRSRPPFVHILTVARVRKKYDCFAVYHEIGAFRKRSSNRRNLKTPDFRFRVAGKRLGNEGFRKRLRHDNNVIFLTEIFAKHKSKMAGYCCVFKFLQHSVEGTWELHTWMYILFFLVTYYRLSWTPPDRPDWPSTIFRFKTWRLRDWTV